MSVSKEFHVAVEVVEDGMTTEAVAHLAVDGEEIVSTGKARRNPHDPDLPLIGDELAIARALLLLARKLGNKVDKGVGAYEGHEVHVHI